MTRRFVIKGVVQGVGFRFFVYRIAEKHGLRGQVWNRGDGAVEIIAQHQDARRLEALEEALWTGPGVVSDVEMLPHGDEVVYEGFNTLKDTPT